VTPDVRCGVVGFPIAHSLSPSLHRAAYAELGLTGWSYGRYEVCKGQLASFVAGLDQTWRGLSITMPLKVEALALGETDRLARLAGAANTLILDRGVRRLYNTDVGGLTWAVRQRTDRQLGSVNLVGGGATARSAVVSAAELGARTVAVLARTAAKAEPLVELGTTLGLEVAIGDWAAQPPEADLVISTVPSTAVDPVAEQVAASAGLVLDVSYNPWPTALANAAAKQGRAVISGLDLLVGQALLQIELMTGRMVSPELLYDAGRDALLI
jgi:shikimate dehydrogenase